MAEKCKECGCKCNTCKQDNQQHCDMHLHVEIENLRQRLLERDNHIVKMETQFLNEADKFPNGELAFMKEELVIWQEKYSRLHEAHKRVQKVNQNLEDKLLRIVDKCETEKGAFTKDIATLSHRLADANYTIHRLTQDNEKYRNDVNLAIQLLQCKPSNFVGQKYDSLPSEVQAKVRTYVAQKRCSTDIAQSDMKSITVPISTFPPTAMVYNITKPTAEKHSDDDDNDECKPPVDVVSATIMAKVLEDREKERIFAKHCETCTCHRSILMVDAETQTCVPEMPSFLEHNNVQQNIKKQTSETPNSEKYQCMDKLKLNCTISHAVFYKIDENVNGDKIHPRVNGDCATQTSCVKDKIVSKNSRNAQNYSAEEKCAPKISSYKKNSSQSHESKYSLSSTRLNDLNKLNIEKAKPFRANNKKCGSLIDNKSTAKFLNRNEESSSDHLDLMHAENWLIDKEQTHIDIINDRLWKNEWTKRKFEVNARDSKYNTNRTVELDIINDRDWKNDRSERQETQSTVQFTLIEVKSQDSSANHNDSSQTEATTSPSFSSDSIAISSSDPSSSCSDLVQSLTGNTAHSAFNKSNLNQSRVTGPRNCLVRVTPGSKNILLDNAGHYNTVLYSSTGGKTSTALVHTKKASRASSERSTSTSSEDNSTVLLQDNQLQRVAEWVQSSLCVSNTATLDSNKASCGENAINSSPSVCPNDSLSNYKEQNGDATRNIRETPRKSKNVEDHNKRAVNNEPSNINPSLGVQYAKEDKSGNFVTYDVLNEQLRRDSHKANLNYEVKITKEMEETYLKLAASLDPVKLSLSRSNEAEMTIEKYRKDYKKFHVQRVQDKMGSKA